MVTKRKRVILAGVGVAVVTALLWHFSRPSQPTHDSRTLTQWMSALGSSDSDEEAHAFAAIEAIGTNGLPTITRFLTKADSPLRLRCLALLDHVPFLRLHFTTAAEWRQKAKVALILSGAESQRASIPALASLSRHANPAVRLTAVDALSQFMFTEPACLPPLEAAQSDIDAQVRATAQEAVQRVRGVSNAVERLRERVREMRSNPEGSFERSAPGA
jgi:hypothetical protein